MPNGRGRGQGGRGMGQGRGQGQGGGGMGQGRGQGRGGRGMGGFCVCPQCGERVPHQPGMPCYQIRCPKCGSPMVRGD